MEGVRRVQGAEGKNKGKAAFALPREFVEALVETANDMAEVAMRQKRHRDAYGHARDALWYTVAFLCCMRKKETLRLRRGHITAGAVKG